MLDPMIPSDNKNVDESCMVMIVSNSGHFHRYVVSQPYEGLKKYMIGRCLVLDEKYFIEIFDWYRRVHKFDDLVDFCNDIIDSYDSKIQEVLLNPDVIYSSVEVVDD